MPTPHRRESGVPGHNDNLHPPCPLSGHQVVHFDFPRANGRQIFSVRCCGERKLIVSPLCGSSRDRLAAVRSDSGPVIVVFVDRDGKYFTDYGYEGMHLRRMDMLMLEVFKLLERDAQPLQQSDFADTTRLEELIDHAGSLHTYPDVDGTFHSLDEVRKAIDQYLSHRLDPKVRMEQDSVSQGDKYTLEMTIWRELYWPDGTRKSRLETLPIDDRRCWTLQLVKVLVDMYNDDHNLSGDLAYKLQRVVRYRYFHDADINGIYYHINFTTKTKGVDGFDCGLDNLLFFAELVQRGREELVVSCIWRVDPSDARGCFACLSGMNHPKPDAYMGGQSEACCFRGMLYYDGPVEDLGCTPAELEAEEASVRRMYEGLDPSDFLERQIEEGC